MKEKEECNHDLVCEVERLREWQERAVIKLQEVVDSTDPNCSTEVEIVELISQARKATSASSTISLSDAIKIWIETGEAPMAAPPYLNCPVDHALTVEFKHGPYDKIVCHRDQRFFRPRKRRTAIAQIDDWINRNNINASAVDGLRILAAHIDDLISK